MWKADYRGTRVAAGGRIRKLLQLVRWKIDQAARVGVEGNNCLLDTFQKHS